MLAILGILCNTAAVAVLVTASRRPPGRTGNGASSNRNSNNSLASVFNSMLTFLLAMHNVYILATAFHVLRRHVGASHALDVAFRHFLYLLKPLALHASTFLTVFMARERNRAIRHPLEYRNAALGASPWRVAGRYAAGMAVAAAAFVSPLYFEVSLKGIAEEVIVGGENGTHSLVRTVSSSLIVRISTLSVT